MYATPPSLFVPLAPPWHCITSVPSLTPCAYYIRLLVYHSKFRKNRKQRCIITIPPLSSLLPRTSLPQNTLFLTFIPISLIIYNERNPQYESSCHSCHKRTAYNLLTYSTFTWSVKSDSKMKLKILSLYRYISKRGNNILLLKEQHINRIIRRTQLLR